MLTAIGYAAAGDPAAALDVLLAYRTTSGGGDPVAVIGEFLLITTTLINGEVNVVTQPWPGPSGG